MRPVAENLARVALLGLIWLVWWWAFQAPLSYGVNLLLIGGGVLLTFPVVWLGRQILDRYPTASSAAWITTFVHVALGLTFGVPIVRAVATYRDGSGWVLPVPAGIGMALVILTGAAFLLVVVNLALKGLGAPCFIALSQRLAVDWLYARTRNPMVLAALAFLLSLGIRFQSLLFVLWVLLLFAPALLFFVKVYEERELELRFGASYLEYRSRTPMLFPRGQGGSPMSKSNRYLVAGGVMSALISLLHVILAIYPSLYRYIGPDPSALTEMAEQGSSITTIVSAALALLFAVWAVYAFSGSGLIPRLPLLRFALIAISAIYILRALFLPSEINMVLNQGYPFRFIVFSTISLLAGLLYLFGLLRRDRYLPRHG